MYLKRVEAPRAVRLADGQVMTQADLPLRDTKRWVASRKAAVVRGVLYGLISKEEALRRYAISEEEFQHWVEAMSQHGAAALRVTSGYRARLP